MFKVEFHKKAVKELKKLDAQIIRIIKQDIDQKKKQHYEKPKKNPTCDSSWAFYAY